MTEVVRDEQQELSRTPLFSSRCTNRCRGSAGIGCLPRRPAHSARNSAFNFLTCSRTPAKPGALSAAQEAPPPVKIKMRPTSFAALRSIDGEIVSLMPTDGEGGESLNPKSFKVVRDSEGLIEQVIPQYPD